MQQLYRTLFIQTCFIYLVYKLDSIVLLQGLDRHSSGVDELGQVYGLRRVHSSQIDQVLESLQRQGLVLRPAAEEEVANIVNLIKFNHGVNKTAKLSRRRVHHLHL